VSFVTTKLKYGLTDSDAGAWGKDPQGEDGVQVLRSTEIGLDGRIRAEDPAIRLLGGQEYRRTKLRSGDLLVVRSSGSDAHLGKVGFVGVEAAGYSFSNFLQRLRVTDSLLPRFVWYFANSFAAKQQIRLLSSTTTGLQNLSAATIGDLRIPTPDISEQRRIADFLDVETARIDLLIYNRKKQMSLLDELGVSRAYSAIRGEQVPGSRQDSGMSWLGEIPASWRIAAVSHLYEAELGKMLNQERVQGSYLRPYLRCANVQWDEITTDDLLLMNFLPQEQVRYRLRRGDLLVCEGGSWPGRSAIWQGEIVDVYYQKALHRLRSRSGDLERWLFYCLLVAEKMKVFAVQGNSSTITHLTGEQLKAQRFPFPAVHEQMKIVQMLDNAAVTDRELRGKFEVQSTLLAERRQALITAAVTGEIDVSTASGRGIED
jgi:type I restriction enzyme S subunit